MLMSGWLPCGPGHKTGCQTASIGTLLLCCLAVRSPLVCQPTCEDAAIRSKPLQLPDSPSQLSESGYRPALGVAHGLDVSAGMPAHLEGAGRDAGATLGQRAGAAVLPVAGRQVL